VERTLIRSPSSKLAPISLSERASVVAKSHIAGKYKAKEDRQSSYEILRGRGDVVAKAEAKEEEMEIAKPEYKSARRYNGTRLTRWTSRGRAGSDSFGCTMAKVVIKELKGTRGRRIVRGTLGGLFKAR